MVPLGFCGARLSSSPPSPFPCTTVRVPIPSRPTGEYFSGRPDRPLHFGSPWPRTRRPPNLCQGPIPYPPSPVLCHAHGPSYLALNWHIAVVVQSVTTTRHGRGNNPRLPRLLGAGTLTLHVIINDMKYSLTFCIIPQRCHSHFCC